MSRQRIRTSVLESSTDKCPHCGGTGHVRSVSSVALQLLRMIEETLQRGGTHNIVARTRSDIALYVLNHKRAHLYDLEHRFQITVTIASDDAISGQLPFVIEKGEQIHTMEQARALAAQAAAAADEAADAELPFVDAELEEVEEDEIEAEAAEGEEAAEAAEGRAEDGEGGRRRRRRRRRGSRRETREEGAREEAVGAEGEGEPALAEPHPASVAEEITVAEAVAGDDSEAEEGDEEETEADAKADHGDGRRRRRRGRRGGRRNRREEGELGISPPENSIAPIDEEVVHAVADFGGPPTELTPEQHHAHEHEPAHPAAEQADRRGRREAAKPEPVPAMAGEPASKPESPRRRSTVREPAPFPVTGGSIAPGAAPAHEPAETVSSSKAAEPSTPHPEAAETVPQPRRAGWWAKRMLGDKG
jgi:ribonuclease E